MDTQSGTTTKPSPDSSKKGVMINGRTPVEEYLEREDRMLSDHPEPLPTPRRELNRRRASED
ncbi:MAG: hypothetical protein WEA80_13075 [Gemmatimonadaceae bacterium]